MADTTLPAVTAEVATPTLRLSDGLAMATSLQVAEHFNKPHKTVLRAIRNLGVSEEFGRHNFVPSSYLNEQGKEQPLYHITRDGFAMLAMGFTGLEAMRWKEAYIAAFNAMEAKLRSLYVAPLLEDVPLRKAASLGTKLKLQEQSYVYMRRLQEATTPVEKHNLYWTVLQINNALGIPTASLQAMGIAPLELEGGAA